MRDAEPAARAVPLPSGGPRQRAADAARGHLFSRARKAGLPELLATRAVHRFVGEHPSRRAHSRCARALSARGGNIDDFGAEQFVHVDAPTRARRFYHIIWFTLCCSITALPRPRALGRLSSVSLRHHLFHAARGNVQPFSSARRRRVVKMPRTPRSGSTTAGMPSGSATSRPRPYRRPPDPPRAYRLPAPHVGDMHQRLRAVAAGCCRERRPRSRARRGARRRARRRAQRRVCAPSGEVVRHASCSTFASSSTSLRAPAESARRSWRSASRRAASPAARSRAARRSTRNRKWR